MVQSSSIGTSGFLTTILSPSLKACSSLWLPPSTVTVILLGTVFRPKMTILSTVFATWKLDWLLPVAAAVLVLTPDWKKVGYPDREELVSLLSAKVKPRRTDCPR